MTPTKPLDGLRVLETAAYISGPYAGALLQSLGAEVVKVELPGSGDAFRRSQGIGSPYFCQYNAGKKSVAINLKRPEGAELVRRLVPGFDVFIDNTRPGKIEALGLGRDVLTALNPRLIYTTVSGFGDGGPWRDRAAYDSMGQSMSGFYALMNDQDDARLSGTCLADLMTGIITATGILAALAGRGLHPERPAMMVQTSLLEAMSSVTIDAFTQFREDGVSPTRKSRHPQAQNFCLRTSDGGGITLHLSSSEKFWHALTRAMDRPDLADHPDFASYKVRQVNFATLKAIVEAEFLTRNRSEWERRLIDADVPFAPVLDLHELHDHPQMQWLDMFEPQDGDKQLLRAPWRFDGVRPTRPVPAPLTGQHTREILSGICDAAELDRLGREGVIATADESAAA
ncbi:MAG: CoA transferase [Paracoccus sp. BP8]|uniref:CaiB/BaiF CoA transferase family protein n=1 Tax=Paracoccus sp. J39 TaxID=935848 RepID=UPI00048E7979|nr:CoA transferase [Paracoccus sp. J39]RQP04166.1 MAG: CoA transferase [Paracoccus sp. BP8]